MVYNLETSELICRHRLSNGLGEVVVLEQEKEPGLRTTQIQRLFEGDELFKQYMAKMKTQMPHHVNKQSLALLKVAKLYSKESETISTASNVIQYQKRADEIAEVYHGK